MSERDTFVALVEPIIVDARRDEALATERNIGYAAEQHALNALRAEQAKAEADALAAGQPLHAAKRLRDKHFEGTPLDEVLTDEDLVIAHGFLQLMEENSLPDSVPAFDPRHKFQSLTLGGLRKIAPSQRAYRVGGIANKAKRNVDDLPPRLTVPKDDVYICEDGTFRLVTGRKYRGYSLPLDKYGRPPGKVGSTEIIPYTERTIQKMMVTVFDKGDHEERYDVMVPQSLSERLAIVAKRAILQAGRDATV